MKKITRYFFTSLVAVSSLLSSCSNDDDAPAPAPTATFSVAGETATISLKEKFVMEATPNVPVTHAWKVDGVLKSTEAKLEWEPTTAGTYQIEYTATNATAVFTHTLRLRVTPPVRPVTEQSNPYVTHLFEYLPAPGQFLNKAPGNLESAQGIIGKRGLVSLGAWGGSIVLGFDHTVLNQPNKEDIMLYGNAAANAAEPGVVWVMQDENGNGLPDDTWYEVAGAASTQSGYTRNYAVTYTRPNPVTADVPWTDNLGNTGVVKTNTFHKQAYYPEWITANSYTLTGSLLPSTNIDMSNPSFIKSVAFAFGYADNTPGGDKVDIDHAVDKDGKPVTLAGIDFIKIQTGIQASLGWLGELSTEVAGVADISLID